MKRLKLLTDEALVDEARRLGVPLSDLFYAVTRPDGTLNPANEPEIRRRIRAARRKRLFAVATLVIALAGLALAAVTLVITTRRP
jgi:hypothetical protein